MNCGQRLLRWLRALGHRADTANEDDDDMHSERPDRPDRRVDPIDVNVHMHFIDGSATEKLSEITRSLHEIRKLIMVTSAQHSQEIRDLTAQNDKATAEQMAALQALQDALDAAGGTTPEVDEAMVALKASIQRDDDQTPDVPPAP